MTHQAPLQWFERGNRRRSVAPRLGSAALRIPDAHFADRPDEFRASGPQIFIHEGARQALERRLAAAFAAPVQLAVTDNRRNMITHKRVRGVQRVRVHMMFLDAPDRVLEALVWFIVRSDRESSQILGDYIDSNNHRIRPSEAYRGRIRTKGKHHDIALVMRSVDETYFGASSGDVLVTWGRRTRPRNGKRSTIQLGSYSATELLVRVHPTLDRKWVPRYFVSYIIFHELLHHVVPAVRVGGRALMHSPEFQRREREFRHYERAIAWERANLGRLLRL